MKVYPYTRQESVTEENSYFYKAYLDTYLRFYIEE